MSNIWCFHHTDADGHCAGAIVRLAHADAQCVSINYGYKKERIFGKVENGDSVYFVDFMPRQEDIEELLGMDCSVTVYDHHVSSMGKTFVVHDNLEIIVDTKRAGCQITWDTLFPDEPRPVVVDMVGQYDLWDHSDERVVPFNYGLMLVQTDPKEDEAFDFWVACFEQPEFKPTPETQQEFQEWGPIDQVLNMGGVAMMYKDARAERMMRNSFEHEVDGFKMLCLNSDIEDSYCFASAVKPEEHDAVLWYYFTGSTWKFSVRKTQKESDFNAAKFAEKFGGGGHRGAAGFALPEFTDFFKVD